jgi:putative hydrolase of the HAD superfamily
MKIMADLRVNKSTMAIKALFFDLDDTLLDDTTATKSYRRQFYTNHSGDIPYTFEEFFRIWEDLVVSSLSKLARGVSSLVDLRRERMRIVFNTPTMPNAEADSYIAEYRDLYEKSWIVFDDTLPALDRLHRSFLLGIVTNGDREQQLKKVHKFNLQNYFKAIVSCEDAKATKPDRAIFDFASAQLGVLNSECVFIGDGYERDVCGSFGAGMKPVWLVRDGSAPSDRLPDIPIIRSLANIFDVSVHSNWSIPG